MSVNYTAIATVLIAFILAAALVKIAQVFIHRFVRSLDIDNHANREVIHRRAKQLIRALTLFTYGIAVLASISFALERFGLSEPDWTPRQVLHWFMTHGINILIVLVASFIVIRLANLTIEHLQFKLARRYATTDLEWQRRATTLSGILTRLVGSAVGFVAALMVLRELTIDIVPILTGAGIAGLAVGFGAQNLVRDVISGFFIILEDQVRVGDAARINGVAGGIEQVNLRTIVLRDGDGAVQVFPNGTITSLANLSKQFGYAIVDLRVAYTENMDRVFGTARDVGASMSNDPSWSGVLLAPLEVLGIESLADGAATVRVRFKTLPLNQGRVANELRRRLMTTFVGRGIRPFAK
ncbi:MAG TPA: mechanosensitive ion channel domain-containing protein [Vicinamibacterales bacterium]|jgi:small conductance mechanosensitive channel